MASYSLAELRKRIGRFPRVELVHLPTPFTKLENLTAALGGPEIYIKRDDLTGLAFGGNKSRKLEFIVSDMIEKKADVVITWASLQSNWCMQTAAAARKFGIRPVLVLFKTYDLPPGYDGNLLLDRILDADIRIRDAEKGKVVKSAEALRILDDVGEEFRTQGLKTYLAPVGGSMPMGDMDRPLGGVAYAAAFAETIDQAGGMEIRPDWIIHATGSGGTQGGLVVGAKALTGKCRVVGISVSDPADRFSGEVLEIARAVGEALDLDLEIEAGDVLVLDAYIREGYGAVDRETAEAIRLVFQTEGIVLDPVYTAKAMVGLIDLVRKGTFKKNETVVFFHTGGTPALFPNRDAIVRHLGNPR